MTLADLASFICGKVNQSETEDLTACKGFLRQRRDMIWADQLWKDSLVEYTQTLSASGYTVTSTWLPTKKVLLQPAIIERVIAVRTGVRKLNVESSDLFYRTDFDAFASQGDAYQFRNLPACVWELDTAAACVRMLEDAADADALMTVSGVNGTTLSRVTGTDLGTVERIDSFSKLATTGAVSLTTKPTTVTVINNSGLALWITVDSLDPTTGSAVANGGTITVTAGIGVTLRGYTTQELGPFGFYPLPAHLIAIPSAFNLWTWTLADVDALALGFDNGFVRLEATDTTAAKRQRIQLIGSVPEPTTIRVLGKTKAPTFTDDGDEAGLTGVDNVLLTLAQGDMLQRERQYGKAQLCYQEGMALLEQLKKQEVVQQAHNKRIMPEDGYGNPYDLYGHSPLSF